MNEKSLPYVNSLVARKFPNWPTTRRLPANFACMMQFVFVVHICMQEIKSRALVHTTLRLMPLHTKSLPAHDGTGLIHDCDHFTNEKDF